MFHKKESKQEGKKMEVKENKKEKKDFNFIFFYVI